MHSQAFSLSSKWWLLLATMALPGCAVTISHPRTTDLDYSDADHYDERHAPSPDYRGEGADPDRSRVPKRVYRVGEGRTRSGKRVDFVPADDED